jgi:hypothetical protein
VAILYTHMTEPDREALTEFVAEDTEAGFEE